MSWTQPCHGLWEPSKMAWGNWEPLDKKYFLQEAQRKEARTYMIL